MKRFSFLRRVPASRKVIALTVALSVGCCGALPVQMGVDGVFARLRALAHEPEPALLPTPALRAATTQEPGDQAPGEEPPPPDDQLPPTIDPSVRRYVDRHVLWSRMREALGAIGDRIEAPGKERLRVEAVLSRPELGAPTRVSVVTEWFDRLRVEMPNDPKGPRVIGFDGRRPWASDGVLDAQSRDLVYTLVFQSAEHFFAANMFGASTSVVGERYRLDDDQSEDYRGPTFDPYQRVTTERGTVELARIYAVNSDTNLVERVYEVRDERGERVTTEVTITWKEFGDQRVPVEIQRSDNGVIVFHLVIESVSVMPRADDGIFDAPRLSLAGV
jgi:hypothetical protein